MRKVLITLVSLLNLVLMITFIFLLFSERRENNRLILENQRIDRLIEDYEKRLQEFKDKIITTVEDRLKIDPSYGKSIKENGVYCGEIHKISNVKNEHEYFFRVPFMYRIDENTVRQVGYMDLKENGQEYIVTRTSYMGVANADEIKDFKKAVSELKTNPLEMKPSEVYRKAIEFFPDYSPMNIYLAYDGIEGKVAWFVFARNNKNLNGMKIMVTPKFAYEVK